MQQCVNQQPAVMTCIGRTAEHATASRQSWNPPSHLSIFDPLYLGCTFQYSRQHIIAREDF